jgi:hypothetical protein
MPNEFPRRTFLNESAALTIGSLTSGISVTSAAPVIAAGSDLIAAAQKERKGLRSFYSVVREKSGLNALASDKVDA